MSLARVDRVVEPDERLPCCDRRALGDVDLHHPAGLRRVEAGDLPGGVDAAGAVDVESRPRRRSTGQGRLIEPPRRPAIDASQAAPASR